MRMMKIRKIFCKILGHNIFVEFGAAKSSSPTLTRELNTITMSGQVSITPNRFSCKRCGKKFLLEGGGDIDGNFR